MFIYNYKMASKTANKKNVYQSFIDNLKDKYREKHELFEDKDVLSQLKRNK